MKNVVLWILSALLAFGFACSKEEYASSEKEILSFCIGDFKSNADGKIEESSKTVTLQAIVGVDITNLSPILTISDKAKISPASGVAQDFTNPVTYTVTAEDGSKQAYTVKVLPPKSSEKVIASFSITSLKPEVVGTIDQNNKTILLKVPFGIGLNDLVPTIAISKKATVTPAANIAQDFSKPVIYTITAEDGTTQDYTVNVEVGKNAEKKITEFKLASLTPTSIATINEVDKKVNLVVPVGTDVTSLVPTLTISTGAQSTPSSNVKQNFSKPIMYTVTAEDGTKQEYTVTVEVEKRTEKKIDTFKFTSLNPVAVATIDEGGKKVNVVVPAGTDITSLIPTITLSAGAQVSPSSNVKQDFSKPTAYTVTAEDGTKQEYTVTVVAAKKGDKKIAEFKFASLSPVAVATIDEEGKKVNVVVPAGTNVTSLIPTLTLSAGAQVSPSSNVKQDFSKPTTYTVTAEDGTKQEYTVTVVAAKKGDKKIAEFKFASLNPVAVATIDEEGKKVNVVVPAGTNVTSLIPTLTLSAGAQVSPSSNVKQDFSKPTTYTVTAEDGTKQEYTITVVTAKKGEKKIAEFKFASLNPAAVATIDEESKKVNVVVPAETDVTSLIPTLTISNDAQVSPLSNVKHDFSKPTIYTVTAEDGTKQEYTITVKVAKRDENKIVEFKFASLNPIVTGKINEERRVISVVVPSGTDITSLNPTLTLSKGAKVSPSSDVNQDFSKPVVYTVTSESGLNTTYTVSVDKVYTETYITEVSSTTIGQGGVLTIKGGNFPLNPVVYFEGPNLYLLKVTSRSTEEVQLSLPPSIELGNYTLSIKANGRTIVYSKKINVVIPSKVPTITRVEYRTLIAGKDELILYGNNLDQLDDTPYISFGNNEYSVAIRNTKEARLWLASTITPGNYSIYLTYKKSGLTSNKQEITVLDFNTLKPRITSVSSTALNYGDELTIKGTNFAESGNRVLLDCPDFNTSFEPAILSESKTEIKVKLPTDHRNSAFYHYLSVTSNNLITENPVSILLKYGDLKLTEFVSEKLYKKDNLIIKGEYIYDSGILDLHIDDSNTSTYFKIIDINTITVNISNLKPGYHSVVGINRYNKTIFSKWFFIYD
jgi:hypothetical protein